MQIINHLTFASDFGDVVYDLYLPDQPCGVLIHIAHGMIEHRGRYVWLCRSLAQCGYRVVIHDHRGHGDSVGSSVPPGEMGANGFERAVEDMYQLSLLIRQQFPKDKRLWIAHSMGSLLARRFLQCYDQEMDGLILSGTPAPDPFLFAGKWLCRVLALAGGQRGLPLANVFSFHARFHRVTGLPGDWACRDEQVIRAYRSDVKCQSVFTTNSFFWLLDGMQSVFSRWTQPIHQPELPILFLSGSDDICGKFGKGVMAAGQHLRDQGYRHVEVKLYEHARHEVFNEPDKAQVLSDMLTWLAAQGY